MRLPLLFRYSLHDNPPFGHFPHSDDFPCQYDAKKPDQWSPAMSGSVYDIWAASRIAPNKNGGPGPVLASGAQRPLTFRNVQLASSIVKRCTPELVRCIFQAHPHRTTCMVALNMIRSLFPAFRGYSQAMIIDEVQVLVSSGVFSWSRLAHLVGAEILRRICESMLEYMAASNEHLVLGSARFIVEKQQLEQRVRLDGPSLADPNIRDLLQESDIFARSFSGGGFGLISPLDLIVQLFALLTEIISHLLLIHSLTRSTSHVGILILSVASVIFPLLLPWFTSPPAYPDLLYTPHESGEHRRKEKMRNLAYSEQHRNEVSLFGLHDWIITSWSTAWKVVFASEHTRSSPTLSTLYGNGITDLMLALQNVPFVLVLQSSSSATLGSMTLYRSSVQAVVFGFRNLLTTIRMAFQTIFLLSAFSASMQVKPKLQPHDDEAIEFKRAPRGMKIEARNLSYTYPNSSIPALININFSLEAGETLAIVGYNGSGKTTLSKILLRVLPFDNGELLINGTDIRKLLPADFHARCSGVFQDISKFPYTLSENVGLGSVDKLRVPGAVEKALHLAEADGIVKNLPHGVQTILEGPGFEMVSYPGSMNATDRHHGLSGGEWQRIALARSFIKAIQPHVDLLVFDEPTSSLDAHAQHKIFETINEISSCPDSGERTKTVIWITHRLSTARRANKIAMMENGTIIEFGRHEDLLLQGGKYAALYNQSI